MKNDITNKLEQSINYVIVDNNIISGGTFDIKIEPPIYGNKLATRLYYNSSLIKLKNTTINYSCPTCNCEWTIILKKFLSKDTLYCNTCKEQVDLKKNNQSKYMKSTFLLNHKIKPKKDKNVVNKKLTSDEYIIQSNLNFIEETDIFKSEYYTKHINMSQFNLIKGSIFKINGFLYNSDMTFYEHLKTSNQNKYSSYLYDKQNDIFINFNNIEYICENCDSTFKTTRLAIEKINNHKILCKTCSLCNKTFKIRQSFNMLNEKIMYQSKPELEFITYCNDNNIYIQNGLTIPYVFADKQRIYRIDFYLPQHKILLEIKDNHIWHKNQLKSGKWQLKEASAIKYAKENNLKYKLIYVENLKEFMNTL